MTFTKLWIFFGHFICWWQRCNDWGLMSCASAFCFGSALKFWNVFEKFTFSSFSCCLLTTSNRNRVDIERSFTLATYIGSVWWFRGWDTSKFLQTRNDGRLRTFCSNNILLLVRFFFFFWCFLNFRYLMGVTCISNELKSLQNWFLVL